MMGFTRTIVTPRRHGEAVAYLMAEPELNIVTSLSEDERRSSTIGNGR